MIGKCWKKCNCKMRESVENKWLIRPLMWHNKDEFILFYFYYGLFYTILRILMHMPFLLSILYLGFLFFFFDIFYISFGIKMQSPLLKTYVWYVVLSIAVYLWEMANFNLVNIESRTLKTCTYLTACNLIGWNFLVTYLRSKLSIPFIIIEL